MSITDRQTDRRMTAINEREREFMFAKNYAPPHHTTTVLQPPFLGLPGEDARVLLNGVTCTISVPYYAVG